MTRREKYTCVSQLQGPSSLSMYPEQNCVGQKMERSLKGSLIKKGKIENQGDHQSCTSSGLV
jgi:hypothetical protein